MALLVVGGAGAELMLALSVPGLFLAGRASARLPALALLLGSAPVRRTPEPLPVALPQAA